MLPIVTLQIIIYLFFSPVVAYMFGAKSDLSLEISIVFLISYVLSYKWNEHGRRVTNCNSVVSSVRIPMYFSCLMFCFTLLYSFEIIRYGLINRRIGSEVAAELFSTIPFFDLAAIRVYEVFLYPLLAVAIHSMRGISKSCNRKSVLLLVGSLLVGFLFSGVLDSRGKLLAPLVYFFALFTWPSARKFHLSRIQAICLGFVVIFGAIISYYRSFAYDDLKDFILVEFVSRTDGLFIIEQLIAHEQIGFFGTFDIYSLKYYLAFFPMLEISKELKLLGLASSKGYFIQDLLGMGVIDSTVSVITEPFYLLGYVGVAVTGIFYGLATSRFDLAARWDQVFSTRVRAAFFIAVLMNFIKFESELIGVLLATGRDFFIIYVGFLCIKFNKTDAGASQQGLDIT